MGLFPLGRLLRHRRGAVSMLTAGALTMLLGCLALAVDLGSVFFESRRLQGVADAAAMSAAGNLTAPNAAAQAMVTASGWHSPVTIGVETGAYHADASLAANLRFDTGAATADAARVTLSADSPIFFAGALLGRRSVRITRVATAARANLAAFSIGTRLAALDGGIANSLLSGLLGTQLDLSVMDYNALLNANVDMLSYADALRSTINLTGGSFDDTLDANILLPQALTALATQLDASGQSAAADVARRAAARAVPGAVVPLDKLIDLGPYGVQDHVGSASIAVGAYDLLQALLELGAGDRQVKLNLGAGVPGVASTTVWLAIGERPANSPWLAVTAQGTPIIRTAQTRLYIDTGIGTGGALQALGIASLRLPILVELAEAQAKLSAISCPAGPSTATVTLLAMPSIGHASIADVDTSKLNNFQAPLAEGQVQIAKALLVSVKGQSRIDLGGVTWQSVAFSAADIQAHTVRQVSTGDVMQGVVASLIGQMNLNVSVIGIGLNVSTITALVGSALQPAAAPLDSLLNSLTGLLGVHLGQADLRVNGVRCGQPALVG